MHPKRTTVLAAAAALLSLASASPSMAKTVVINAVFDPATLVGWTGNETSITPVTLGIGDSLDITATFTSGQTVTYPDGYVFPFIGLVTHSGPYGALTVTGTLDILGASPNLVASSGPITQQTVPYLLGIGFLNEWVQTAPGPTSFTGLHEFLTIDSGEVTVPRTYETAFYYHHTPVSSGVPEPAIWGLMIGGFGLAGQRLRRRFQRSFVA